MSTLSNEQKMRDRVDESSQAAYKVHILRFLGFRIPALRLWYVGICFCTFLATKHQCAIALKIERVPNEIQGGKERGLGMGSTKVKSDLEQIFDAVNDPMWVVNSELRITRINQAFAKHLGKTPQEVIGKSCETLLLSDLCQTDECCLKTLLTNPQVEDHDVDVRLSCGEVKSYIHSASPLRKSTGEVFAVVSSCKDITKRKTAEISLREANRELARLASIDVLTGLANRRRFETELQREWFRAAREKTTVSLIMIDVDLFKTFNDTYGHQVGDGILHSVAETIRLKCRRPADLVARYGGEELVVLLPNTEVDGAVHVAETMRQAVHDLKVEHPVSSVADVVTISAGVAGTMPARQIRPGALVKAADQALYEAKQTGRNKVVVKTWED